MTAVPHVPGDIGVPGASAFRAALAARSGAPVTALLTAALAPLARRFARKVTIT
ncbi:hypothetical protein ACIHFB_16830 [Streptomyces sp. NPDC051963]|uniref:hypothetical protein n=1 Tax=Streptomyces sp. NPDC051963 TaxID=3365678 RepID=UPI0037CD1A28